MKRERFVRKALRLASAMAALAVLASVAGCSLMGKSTPKSRQVTLKLTATSRLNNCGKSVPQRLYYRVIQLTDAAPLAGMKLENVWDRESEMLGGAFISRGADLSVEPNASRPDAPVTLDARTKAVVVIGNFCMTQGSCFYFSQAIPEKQKKALVLDLTADSTCIGPTRH
jgi:type VI secretion system VasD/TssJ family lipoprotein